MRFMTGLAAVAKDGKREAPKARLPVCRNFLREVFIARLILIQDNLFLCPMLGLSYSIQGEEAVLLPDRAVYFPQRQTLIISDVHLGKVNHFRKAGIAVPLAANQANLERLITLLMTLQPARLIFIGDLFHSHYNAEWEALAPIVQQFKSCAFELLPGNHDIMSLHQYERHQIKVLPKQVMLTAAIMLTHAPLEKETNAYVLCGHVHPAITMRGRGKQALTLPCFWFSQKQAILPAFGVFTGVKPIQPKAGDKVFAVLKREIIDVSSSPAPIKNDANRKLKAG
jgi:uncharacterized protein